MGACSNCCRDREDEAQVKVNIQNYHNYSLTADQLALLIKVQARIKGLIVRKQVRVQHNFLCRAIRLSQEPNYDNPTVIVSYLFLIYRSGSVCC